MGSSSASTSLQSFSSSSLFSQFTFFNTNHPYQASYDPRWWNRKIQSLWNSPSPTCWFGSFRATNLSRRQVEHFRSSSCHEWRTSCLVSGIRDRKASMETLNLVSYFQPSIVDLIFLNSTSDQHFGVGANLILPGRGKDMGDGWETKRSRAKGHKDWVVIKL